MEGVEKFEFVIPGRVIPTRLRAFAQLLQLESAKLKFHGEQFDQEVYKDLAFRFNLLSVAIYQIFPQPEQSDTSVQNYKDQMYMLSADISDEEDIISTPPPQPVDHLEKTPPEDDDYSGPGLLSWVFPWTGTSK